jgi:hypothetical protein
MRKIILVVAATAILVGAILFHYAGKSAKPAGKITPAAAAVSSMEWSCTAFDGGDQNPGPNCPRGNKGYQYHGITNANGRNTSVINDVWNPPGSGHPQTIYVNNPGDWAVVANMPEGNTAVLSYPDIQQILTLTTNVPAPLSGFNTIVSDFRESMPNGGDNEAAYDIWLGTSKQTNYSQEVMIWVDNHRTNLPPGNIVGRPVFYNERFTVWQDGRTIYMLRDHNETSGRIHILSMLDWLVRHGYSPKGSGLNQIDFGWELCSTDGKYGIFTISDYALRMHCAQQGTACWST